MKSLHHLPPEYREWLSAAAMLYEVGDYVNRNGRHRHAHYIISNSEILGYTPEQRRIIAAIARYLGKSRPTPTDSNLKGLQPLDQEHIAKASMLLRLARSMNLGTQSRRAKGASKHSQWRGQDDTAVETESGPGSGALGNRERSGLLPRTLRAGAFGGGGIERTQHFGCQAPRQRSRTATKFDLGDRSLPQLHGRFASSRADNPSEEFAQSWDCVQPP